MNEEEELQHCHALSRDFVQYTYIQVWQHPQAKACIIVGKHVFLEMLLEQMSVHWHSIAPS